MVFDGRKYDVLRGKIGDLFWRDATGAVSATSGEAIEQLHARLKNRKKYGGIRSCTTYTLRHDSPGWAATLAERFSLTKSYRRLFIFLLPVVSLSQRTSAFGYRPRC